jgi:broad specificity phosphatase PhoE
MGQGICRDAGHGDGAKEDAVHRGSAFLHKQTMRPKRVILIRHGQSEGNLHRKITESVPDHLIHLTAKGREEALECGRRLKSIIGDGSAEFVASPYVRAVETLCGIAQSFGGKDSIDSAEDVYIREQDFGNFDKPEARALHQEKKVFGKFYYRFPEGESPADLYLRAGLFLESLYRKWESRYTDNMVIVSHELFIIVFLMRLFRWPVKDFYAFEDLSNCEIIVLEREDQSIKFEPAYTWPSTSSEKVPGGIARKANPPCDPEIWNGDPAAPELVSTSRKMSSS